MAQIKSRLTLTFNLYETTNQNRLKTGGALSAYVYPAGVQVEGSATIPNGVSLPITCSGRGSLSLNSAVYVLRSVDSGVTWTEQYVTGLSITAIEEQNANEGRFSFTVQNSSGAQITLNIGDRIVAARTLVNLVTLYEDETDPSDFITSNPIDVPESGVFTCYVTVRGVDVYLTGDTITSGWYSFNVPSYSGLVGPLRLKSESLAANTTVNVDADTAALFLTTDTAAIEFIEHCAPGRELMLVPLVTGLQITTVSTATDNAIREAAGRTIDLTQYEPVRLIGVEASSNIAYWVIQSKLAGVGLDDLDDVTVGTPANPSILVSTGADFTDSQTLGTDTDPFQGLVVASGGFKIADAEGDASTIAFSGAADRTHTLPDVTGNILVDTGTHTVTGEITVDDDALILRDPAATTKKARLDCGSITAGNTRVLTVQDKNYTIADDADVPAELNDLTDFTDIGAGATTDGWPVVYRHGTADHRIDDDLASFDYPMTTIHTQSVSLVKSGVGSFKVDIAPPLSASGNLSFRLPGNASGGTLLATTPAGQVVTGDIAFDDDGLFIHDPADTTKQARFDAGAITAGNTRVVSLADRNMDLAKQAQGRAITVNFEVQDTAGSGGLNLKTLLGAVNGILLLRPVVNIRIKRVVMDFLVSSTLGSPAGQLQIYNAATLPSTATVPPTGTAMLSSAANLASLGAGRGTLINATSFASDTVAAGNYLFLAASATVTAGTTSGSLFTLTIEYEVNE